MDKMEIINQGHNDLLDIMNQDEMNLVMGGLESASDHVSCKKGYTTYSCKCGYEGPAFPPTSYGTHTEP